ncbi:hypothetical protein PG987_000310 [Apiospora arundinis]
MGSGMESQKLDLCGGVVSESAVLYDSIRGIFEEANVKFHAISLRGSHVSQKVRCGFTLWCLNDFSFSLLPSSTPGLASEL